MILSKSKIYESRIINGELSNREIQEHCRKIRKKLWPVEYGVIMAAEKGYEKLMCFFASICKQPWDSGLFWAVENYCLNLMQFFIAMGADDWFTAAMQYTLDGKVVRYMWKKFYE